MVLHGIEFPEDRVAAFCERHGVRRLAAICVSEGRELGEAVLARIARAAGGGMRDAQTLLDQLIAVSDGEIHEEDLNLLLGAARGDDLNAVVESLLAGKAGDAIAALDRIGQVYALRGIFP